MLPLQSNAEDLAEKMRQINRSALRAELLLKLSRCFSQSGVFIDFHQDTGLRWLLFVENTFVTMYKCNLQEQTSLSAMIDDAMSEDLEKEILSHPCFYTQEHVSYIRAIIAAFWVSLSAVSTDFNLTLAFNKEQMDVNLLSSALITSVLTFNFNTEDVLDPNVLINEELGR